MRQFYVLAGIAFIMIVLAFYLMPATESVPAINNGPPVVEFSANHPHVRIEDITSTLDDSLSAPGVPAFIEYALTGKVIIESKKPVLIYVGITGLGQVHTDVSTGWTLENGLGGASLEQWFHQGTRSLSIYVNGDECNCDAYSSPYLRAESASVVTESGGPNPPRKMSEWPVTLGFHGSELDLGEEAGLSPDYSISSSYPVSPIGTRSVGSGPGDWFWPDTGSGMFVAVDLSASADLNTRLFYAGLLFGVAGAAIVAFIPEYFRQKERRRPANEEASQPPHGGDAHMPTSLAKAMQSNGSRSGPLASSMPRPITPASIGVMALLAVVCFKAVKGIIRGLTGRR